MILLSTAWDTQGAFVTAISRQDKPQPRDGGRSATVPLLQLRKDTKGCVFTGRGIVSACGEIEKVIRRQMHQLACLKRCLCCAHL